MVLKRTKVMEKQLDQTMAELDNLKTMISTIEFAKIQAKVAEGMENGNKAMRMFQNELSLEDAQRIMDETQEGMEYLAELDRICGENLTEQDNDELQDQLDQMFGALDEEKPTPVQPAEPVLPVTEPVLPTVDPVLPVTEPVVAEPVAAGRQEVPDAMLI